MSNTARQQEQALARAVEQLARPHTVEHMTRISGGGRKLLTSLQDPLITMLRTNGTPSQAAAGSSPAARALVDADALEKLRELRDHIEQLWTMLLPARIAPALLRPPVTLEDSLHAWHVLFAAHGRAGTRHLPHLTFAVDLTAYWVTTITERFDPPRTGEITDRCPKCGNRYGHSDMGDRVTALRATYGPGIPDLVVDCRACGSRWVGELQIRGLRAAQVKAQEERTADAAAEYPNM